MKSDPENFFDSIFKQDETWVHHFDPEIKKQSMEWRRKGSQCPRKFKAARKSDKVIGGTFWDCEGINIIDYFQKGKTINGQYYADELARLQYIKELTKGALLLHSNAPVHRVLVADDPARDYSFEIHELTSIYFSV